MEYRRIGKTDMRASVIGLGTEHLDEKPYDVVEEVVNTALDNGVNILDVFMPGAEVRKNIGKALGSRRGDILIQGHLCSVDLNQQYDISRDLDTVKRYFDDLLTHLRTDYIDFGMLFFLDSPEDFDAVRDNGIVRYAEELKDNGVVRALGASSHNPAVAKNVVESGLIDLLMFSVNPAFDMMPETRDIETMLTGEMSTRVTTADPDRAALYRLCQSRQVAITTMKTYGAGKLLSAEHTPFVKPLTPEQCIHYALTRPGVVSVLPGCASRSEVLEAVGYLQAGDAEKDYAPVVAQFRDGSLGDFRGSCVYCNHCLPCPADINIAETNRYLDIALLTPDAIPPSVQHHYRALKKHGSDCFVCGNCEDRCPFAVPVIDNMKKAAALFGQ